MAWEWAGIAWQWEGCLSLTRPSLTDLGALVSHASAIISRCSRWASMVSASSSCCFLC